jgi:hypothetical protein
LQPESSRPLSELVAAGSSRRGFLSRLGRALVATAAGGLAARAALPEEAEAHHFCGHIFTTGSCPHPTGLPRIDAKGFPLRARDGKPVDDYGRPIDRHGRPVDSRGRTRRDPDGRPLPPGPRTRVCRAVSERYGFPTWVDGAWYRCCGGRVRKLVDCCSYSRRRINGDRALTGYCYRGRKVFCVLYYQTKISC